MGLALFDYLTPWRRTRISEFFGGAGHAHAYMVHVGAGWVWARLPINFRRAKTRLDPVLGWLAFDGWGFHEGFFHWPKHIAGQPPPKKLKGYERHVFDQGLGRSFWFVNGGNVELLVRTISDFPPDRRGDLWSGIGLAATYAGIISEISLDELREKSGPFQPQLAQGAAFAAKARQRAGNLTDYTSLATKILCGLTAADAARLTDTALENLPADSDVPAYEIWRRRIQDHFVQTRQLQEA
jgi:enediyne biosynthesis protein E3